MLAEHEFEGLVTRVVDVVAIAVLSDRLSGALLLGYDDLARAREAHRWLKHHLADQESDALQKLELEPGSEDNKAYLRKRLLQLLERAPSAAEVLDKIVPESVRIERASTVIANVGAALDSAAFQLGLFGKRTTRSTP